jgi:hypothetical protein
MLYYQDNYVSSAPDARLPEDKPGINENYDPAHWQRRAIWDTIQPWPRAIASFLALLRYMPPTGDGCEAWPWRNEPTW